MTYNKMIYEPLVVAGPNGTVLPNLAKSWSLSFDRKTLTIVLQSGVNFTNGKPFNSAAALSSLQYGADPANAMDAQLPLTGCKFATPTPTTVVITMPTAEENALLNSFVTLPMVDTSSNLNSDPIGTAPYEVASFTPNVQVNLVRNPHYWNPAGRAKIANVELKIFESEAAEIAALEA
jgi:peptide/nickel transport system substrate-binding protein